MNVPLKIAIIQRGIKQFDLSRLLGVDPAKVSKIVNGWTEPNKETKRKISQYLGKPIDELFPNDVETRGVHAEP